LTTNSQMFLKIEVPGRILPPLLFSSFEEIQEFLTASAKTLGAEFHFQIEEAVPALSLYVNLYTVIFNIEDRSISYFTSNEVSVVRTPQNSLELIVSSQCFYDQFVEEDRVTHFNLTSLVGYEMYMRTLEYPLMKLFFISPLEPTEVYPLIKASLVPDFLKISISRESTLNKAWPEGHSYENLRRHNMYNPLFISLRNLFPIEKHEELYAVMNDFHAKLVIPTNNFTDQFMMGDQPVELQPLDPLPDFHDEIEEPEEETPLEIQQTIPILNAIIFTGMTTT